MGWPFKSKFSPIGLDLGSHGIAAIQLARTGDGWTLNRAVSLDRPSPQSPIDTGDLVRMVEVMERRGFVGRDVVISVPSTLLLNAMLELPPRAPGVPIEQIARLEFARVHKKEPADLTMSIWELPAPARVAKATYMLGVGAQSSDLDSCVDLIESANLNLLAIEEPHSAAARGCLNMAGGTSGLLGIIDLGWSATTLTILLNQTIVYTRKLNDAGMKGLCQQLADISGIDIDDATDDIWRIGSTSQRVADEDESAAAQLTGVHATRILKEVSSAFSYAGHRYADSTLVKVILIGGGAMIPGMHKTFAQSLGAATLIGRICKDIADAKEPGPAFISALGLALWPGRIDES